MNILILNWKDIKHPQVGGAEIIVYELAKRMVEKGDRVTWFCRSFKGGNKKDNIEGIEIVRRGSLYSVYIHAVLYYLLLKKKPDIVIDMSNTIYWQTPLWVRKSKIIAYLNQLAKEVFDWEYSPFLAKLGKIIEKLQYATYKKITFICYANSTKRDLIDYGIPGKNIHTFPLGLDHTRYKPGKKSKYPLFLCVSRLVRMKRTDLAIEAFAQVVKEYKSARLAIVGYGYERGRLEKSVDEMKLGKSVYFVDKNNLFFTKSVKDQKVKIMQRAWCLLFPSVKEGWGMTVTECAACGTPSIVTDVTGLRDSVIKDKTGIIVSANPSAYEIARQMMMLIENDRMREGFSKNAIEWAGEFNWERSFEEFYSLIKELS